MSCMKLLSLSSQRAREQEGPGFSLPADRKVLSQANLTLTLKHAHFSPAYLLKKICVLKSSWCTAPSLSGHSLAPTALGPYVVMAMALPL